MGVKRKKIEGAFSPDVTEVKEIMASAMRRELERCPVLRLKHDLLDLLRIEKLPDYLNDPADREFETRTGAAVNRSRFNRC